MSSPFQSPEAPKPSPNIYLTEVIHPSDPRAAKFDSAKKKEIEGLIKRGTWKIVLRDEAPKNANILGGSFVLAIIDSYIEKEVWKARYVVQGHKDKLKTSLVHDVSTARQFSVKMLVGLAVLCGFRLYSTDVTQAYLQSAENLMRDVYIKPSREFTLGPDQVLKLLKSLYGLADSGDYCGRTLKRYLIEELGMKQNITDGAFFFQQLDEMLSGLCATYVDDCLQARE